MGHDAMDTQGKSNLTRNILAGCAIFFAFSCHGQDQRTRYFPNRVERPESIPQRKDVWVFVMAGQSNMAGRGMVEPSDTVSDPRILTLNRNNEIVVAKEPLHFYEPTLTGLDCGLSFGKKLVQGINPSVTILIVPTAVGGSSSLQWLGDSLHRDVHLLTNFRERVEVAKKYGTIKGILWHQGESDTHPDLVPGYEERLRKLFSTFRMMCDDASVPIIIGELGSYSNNPIQWSLINKAIHRYAKSDKNAMVVGTGDLKSKEDKIHFDAAGQRLMGERMATQFLMINRRQ